MKKVLLTAAALFAVSTAADAALLQVNYVSIVSGAPQGPPSPGLIGGSGTWTYDDVTGTLTGTGTVTNTFSFSPGPSGVLYTHTLTDLAITGAGVASASAYSCLNGPAAVAALNRDLCAQYAFNTLGNESTVDPTGLIVTLGGDDTLTINPPQTLAQIFNMGTRVYSAGPPLNIGDTIKLSKGVFNPAAPGTFQMTFQVVPVPAAVWLFGSALGVMGIARRKRAA